MANRDNHYEAAFEAYLRDRRLPYVAVDEAKRSVLAGGESIKSLDFIVSSPGGLSWLVDVKGRRFPSGDDQKQYWKNWSPREDLGSLARWEAVFGESFRGLFVFAYNIVGDRAPLPPEPRRPSVARPTGTLRGAPVSTASAPRSRPSVGEKDTHLTQLFPTCYWASSTILSPFRPISMAL